MPASAITVQVPGSSYVVTIGSGLLSNVAELVYMPSFASKAAIVTVNGQPAGIAAGVARDLAAMGLKISTVELPDGEHNKTLGTLTYCLSRFDEIGITRHDIVVAVGGGMVGDVAAFAAAIWQRGVAVTQIPTTIIGQVDAAIGGKTGVNFGQGKNMVGAFHQPNAVIADIDILATLPERERRAGFGEVVKYGFIADPSILDILLENTEKAVACQPEILAEIVEKSVRIKARIVGSDERESAGRAILNYGHTLGHAIESLTGYQQYRHGEAISIGMVFAARLGERMGVSQPGLADQTEFVLSAIGLPSELEVVDRDTIFALMSRDKKVRRQLRFVLCSEPGTALLVDAPGERMIKATLDTLHRHPRAT